ncbi:MAG: hypothetical protein Q8S44_01265 [Flavobacteriaceae bacterium]|nr:hypothetical protein [Flavobacteriaceae bacterium]
MASVKNLKKDINYVLGDVVDAIYLWEMYNPKADTKASQVVVEEAFTSYDQLIARVNQKKIENKKDHFALVRKDLETIANSLVEKVNSL